MTEFFKTTAVKNLKSYIRSLPFEYICGVQRIAGQKFMHRQGRESKSIAVAEEPIFSATLLRTFSLHNFH
jgi:hypothetical protein